MADPSRGATSRCSRLRQARGTSLNTIVEETREQRSPEGEVMRHQHRPGLGTPQLRLQTTSPLMPPMARRQRLKSPLSAGSVSSCSDREWQSHVRAFDDLYDATDEETEMEMSDGCTSISSTRSTTLATPITRASTVSMGSRNRYPPLSIPSTSVWPSLQGAHKSSPVPPTPPPKIPVSPAVLSLLPHSVPALHAPPSLDGSLTSDQISNISSPATPDLRSLPDNDWTSRGVWVRPETEELEDERLSDPQPSSEVSIEISIEQADEDWQGVLGSFPGIPRVAPGVGAESTSATHDSGTVVAPGPSDEGLVLPDDALAILQYIPLDGSPDPWSEKSEAQGEMWELHIPQDHPRTSEDQTPASALSGYSFTSLSIPSPGGFFASLAPRARNTWSFSNGHNPPSSATAENFYNCPWNRVAGEIVEQVVECPEEAMEDGQLTAVPPTAIRIPLEEFGVTDDPPQSPVVEISRSKVTYEYDEHYDEDLKERAVASLDRTSVWLAAQASYLAALGKTNPLNEIEVQSEAKKPPTEKPQRLSTESSCKKSKKSVRFIEILDATTMGPSALASKDSIYWRGFKFVRSQSTRRDTFVHRNTRFDAIQSVRLGLVDLHVNSLMGKFEIVPHARPPYKGPFSLAPRNSILASALTEKAEFLKLQKEQAVLSQLQHAMWAIDALKYLNGGRLNPSPAHRALSRATAPLGTAASAGKRRVRVLDLGGQGTCDWAWHLAYEHPNVKVYTVVSKQQTVNDGIKGPPNHRQVSVMHLWKLPFRDNQFDVISARSLHACLKSDGPASGDSDEYDLCLKECYRCLKPGGYLEFFLMDAEISRAGPYASATSVEFAFNLRTRGYDPNPTKSFLFRLRESHFTSIKRAWMFLPMGVEPAKPQLPRETPEPSYVPQIHQYEAVQGPVGSTADIASVTGLLGGWIWEQWLLKLQLEMGRDKKKLLTGIGSVFDEGRKNGAGWTCLSGWAMKPNRKRSRTITAYAVV